jgi:hypothetical protein
VFAVTARFRCPTCSPIRAHGTPARWRSEGNFAITIALEQGKGGVSGFLATHYPDARLTFSNVEIDQSYLQETRRQVAVLLADA